MQHFVIVVHWDNCGGSCGLFLVHLEHLVSLSLTYFKKHFVVDIVHLKGILFQQLVASVEW